MKAPAFKEWSKDAYRLSEVLLQLCTFLSLQKHMQRNYDLQNTGGK